MPPAHGVVLICFGRLSWAIEGLSERQGSREEGIEEMI